MDMRVSLPESVASEIIRYCDIAYAIVSPDLTVECFSEGLLKHFSQQAHFESSLEQALGGVDIADTRRVVLSAAPNPCFDIHQLEAGNFLVVNGTQPEVNDSAAEELSLISHGLSELADCNLDFHLGDNLNADSQSKAFLQTTMANLNEAVKQIHSSCARINNTSLNLNAQSKELAARSTRQFEATEATSSSMEELSATIAHNAEKTSHAEKTSIAAVDLAKEGNRSLEQMISAISQISDSAKEMNKIIETVDLITFQTNILSINAAVEAAHAGEHGRGFSIVAQEVRALAKRSKASSTDIKDLINSTLEACVQAKTVAENSGQVVTQMSQKILDICDDMSFISSASKEQATGIDQATRSLADIASLADQNNDASTLLSQHTLQLRQEVEQMQDVIGVFKLNKDSFSHPTHKEVCDLVQQASDAIRCRLEVAILDNEITHSALFDRNYIEVQDSNPSRYQTRFDQFTDEHVGPIQEQWLAQHPSLVYLIVSDENGYVPTHNQVFSQPLTGNPEQDVARNRTKRIFTDRVGLSVGKHTEAYLIQTYRRDTGELMFDLSVPLFVNGEHWGGVRAGYRLQA